MLMSVVMATYNGQLYLKEQIESILAQDLVPNEIIIVDDFSSDNTIQIIEDFQKNTSVCIKLIKHNINKGVLESFRDGLNIVEGNIVFFCDQDDVWYKNKTAQMVKIFENNSNIMVVFSNADIVDCNLEKTGLTLWNSIRYVPGKIEDIKYELFKRNIFTGMCMAVRREWALSLPEFSNHMLHDEFFGWCAASENKAMYVDLSLVAYRQHNKNVVGSGNYTKFQNIKQTKKIVEQSSNDTKEKYYDLYQIVQDIELKMRIKKAESFYRIRSELFTEKRIIALGKCLREISKGNYFTFCSKTEYAIQKDLLGILL